MTKKNWLDINEIADYLDHEIGKNRISNSTLRRWINAEVKNSPNVETVKRFNTSALGSKKPVTKYNIKLVNQMLEHNLTRIQKRVDNLDPTAIAKIKDNERDEFTRELVKIQDLLANQQAELKAIKESSDRQYKTQVWLDISRLQLLAANHQQELDSKGLFHDIINGDFHADVRKYIIDYPKGDSYDELDDLQKNDNLNRTFRLNPFDDEGDEQDDSRDSNH